MQVEFVEVAWHVAEEDFCRGLFRELFFFAYRVSKVQHTVHEAERKKRVRGYQVRFGKRERKREGDEGSFFFFFFFCFTLLAKLS